MSEKLCLQWNDFQDNVKSAFGNLRESTDFVDVTLACEDCQQMEAHGVIENILANELVRGVFFYLFFIFCQTGLLCTYELSRLSKWTSFIKNILNRSQQTLN